MNRKKNPSAVNESPRRKKVTRTESLRHRLALADQKMNELKEYISDLKQQLKEEKR